MPVQRYWSLAQSEPVERIAAMIKGVDVSHWQGDIDFEALKRQGYEFAMIKATQGDYFVDPNLKQNVAKCEAAGMAHGLYHFLDPCMDEWNKGNEQLDYFHENTIGLHGQLPNALDAEWMAELTIKQYCTLVVDFLQSAILRWLLYANLNFLNYILYEVREQIKKEADIWLAWPSGITPPKMPRFYDESSVKIWQWDWSDNLDKNRVLDDAWYYAHVQPQIYAVVKIIAPPGITFDIEYE